MGFLDGLFKKKEGGTFFGNLLRVGASSVTGGILGSGANMIPLGGGQKGGTIPAYVPPFNVGGGGGTTTTVNKTQKFNYWNNMIQNKPAKFYGMVAVGVGIIIGIIVAIKKIK